MNHKEERFKEIINEQHRRISSICRYYTKGEDDQKDLYQEILVNIWKSLETFRGDSAIGTWVYRVAVNTALGFAGKTIRRMQVSVSLDDKALKIFSDDEKEQDYVRKEQLISDLQDQINLLNVIDKVLITLMLEGLSYREIADIVGVTEPNVRIKIHRIKETLREKLKGGNYEQ